MFRLGENVIYISNKDILDMTRYKRYVVKSRRFLIQEEEDTEEGGLNIEIIDDNNEVSIIPNSYFISLKEYRKQKINKIYESDNKRTCSSKMDYTRYDSRYE